jgi:hypothetical protein
VKASFDLLALALATSASCLPARTAAPPAVTFRVLGETSKGPLVIEGVRD